MSAQETRARKNCREEHRSGSVKVPERISDPVSAACERPIGFYQTDGITIAYRHSSNDRPSCLVAGCADRARIMPRILWVAEKPVVRHLIPCTSKRRLAAASLLLIASEPFPSAP